MKFRHVGEKCIGANSRVSVAVNQGGISGVLHKEIDQQGTPDASGYVPEKAGLHTDAFKPQAHILDGATEH